MRFFKKKPSFQEEVKAMQKQSHGSSTAFRKLPSGSHSVGAADVAGFALININGEPVAFQKFKTSRCVMPGDELNITI
jgi:hypothetical protein